jgi:type I restriction enzyme, S subunit
VNLPQGWTTAKLADAAEIIRGIAFEKGAKVDGPREGYVPCLRTTNVQREVTWDDLWFIPASLVRRADKWLQRGDILISTANSYELVGKVAPVTTVPSAATLGAFISAIRPHPQHNPRFIYFQLASSRLQHSIRALASTTTNISNVSTGKLATVQIRLPPREEQDLIVSEIEKHFTRLDAAHVTLQAAGERVRLLRTATLHAAVTGKLVPLEAELARSEGRQYEPGSALIENAEHQRRADWNRGRYVPPRPVASANLPALPEGWSWASWEQLSMRVTVGHVGPMKKEYVAAGIPFLRSQNIRPNRFDHAGLLYITSDFHKKLEKSRIRARDIAVVRSGAVGVSCVIPEHLEEANCADLVLIQQPLGIEPRFGSYYMNSAAQRRIQAGRVGIALTHFNTNSVASLPVPVPPLAEQQRIVGEVERRLSLIDALEAAVSSTLERVPTLRRTLLSQAFSGQLTSGTTQAA